MARTVNDILKHANELAHRFKAYEPDPADEISVAEYQLGIAAIERARIEQQVIEAVANARQLGLSWRRIGSALGTSHQAAQTRYAHAVRQGKQMLDVGAAARAVADAGSLRDQQATKP